MGRAAPGDLISIAERCSLAHILPTVAQESISLGDRPSVVFATPRKLPKPKSLVGRVAVLDIAFASGAGGATFEKVTQPFLDGLGPRLAAWVDHHDHELHAHFASDPRFVLATKQEHGACPEMITPSLVARIGKVDTLCCHTDFDGICAAAKWILGGHEPYEGADRDAWCIDTRMGEPSPRAQLLDRALRGAPSDAGMRGLVLRFLLGEEAEVLDSLKHAAQQMVARERESRLLADRFRRYEASTHLVVCDVTDHRVPYDKTQLLLAGQALAPVAVVLDAQSAAFAARYDSGIDLTRILSLEGGMPTRVSISRKLADAGMQAVALALETAPSN